ncbi:MAG: hypothetical protein OXE75_04085, partial [bacterium]|nr:hypothetical protein [bacterium]
MAHRAGASQEQFLDGVAPFDPVPPETARLTVILVASPYRRGASLPGASVGPASIAASVAPPAAVVVAPAALSAAVAAASAAVVVTSAALSAAVAAASAAVVVTSAALSAAVAAA